MGQSLAKQGRRAAKQNDIDSLQRVASANPQALLKPSMWKHRTALHSAASSGSLAALVAVCDVAQTAAPSSEHASLIGFLNCPDFVGDTALARACRHGHADCVRELLEAGANPLPANSQGSTTLHTAAAAGYAACIRLLLTAPVRLADGSRCRAADAAVQDVIDTERFIDARNHSGLCGLHLAVLGGSQAAVAELCILGASLDTPLLPVGIRAPTFMPACLSAGSTALHMAAATGRAALCITLLHAQQQRHPGLELRRMRNARGMTPLNVALLCGHRHLASLLAAGAPLPIAPSPTPARSGHLPPLLRQQLLALVHRAALLGQLRQLGLGSGAVAAGEGPSLPSLPQGTIERMETLLRSDSATATQVLDELDSLLEEAAAAAAGTGTSSSGTRSGGGGRGGAAAGSNAAQRRQRRRQAERQEAAAQQQLAAAGQPGVDWTLLERNRSLWHAEHVDRPLYRRLHRRRQQQRQLQAAVGLAVTAPTSTGEAAEARGRADGLAADAAGGEDQALFLAGALLHPDEPGSLQQQEPQQRQRQQGREQAHEPNEQAAIPCPPHPAVEPAAAAVAEGKAPPQEASGEAATAAAEAAEAAGASTPDPPASAPASLADGTLCPICLDLPAGIAIVPCGHTACLSCCGRLASYCTSSSGGGGLLMQGPLCPLCRAPIEAFQHVPQT